MDSDKSELLEALAKIPGLDELDIPVEDLPLGEDLRRMTDELMVALDKELAIIAPAFEASLASSTATSMDDERRVRPRSASESALTPGAPRPRKSKPVTIRMPIWLLEEYRNKAATHGGAYQTLIVRTLTAAARSW